MTGKKKAVSPELSIRLAAVFLREMTNAAAHALTTGQAVASRATAQKRLRVCHGCEHFTGKLCNQCGCFMAMKVWFVTSVCPAGKWPSAARRNRSS